VNRIHRDESALYHACGYSCDNAIYLKLGTEAFFITDGRYTIDAKANVRGAEVITARNLPKAAAKVLHRNRTKKILYDPMEWDVHTFERLKAKTALCWRPKLRLAQKKRIIKTPEEIHILEKAVQIGAEAFDTFAGKIDQKGIGLSEQELYLLAQEVLRGNTGRPFSFEPIVAIGSNAAKPHAHPEKITRLHRGDLLLFDAGIKHKGYCSDRTRTVRVKKGFTFDDDQRFKSKQTQKAYDTVRKAHDRAIAKARSGMRARKVDALAREVIDKAGFGQYFVHGTGHGVGLDIHELPVISSRSQTRIEDGMVYTIEPGIYLPGQFGIRIEDMVVMENGRARVL